MAGIISSFFLPSAALLAGFEAGTIPALEFPGPAPCIRAMFPCQRVSLHFFVRRLCPVEDRCTAGPSAAASLRSRGL